MSSSSLKAEKSEYSSSDNPPPSLIDPLLELLPSSLDDDESLRLRFEDGDCFETIVYCNNAGLTTESLMNTLVLCIVLSGKELHGHFPACLQR